VASSLHAAPAAGIRAWRRDLLCTAGFELELARRIAAAPAFDVHAVIELVERGCPPPLAARILAPLDSEAAW
jgi:hypothetical protein